MCEDSDGSALGCRMFICLLAPSVDGRRSSNFLEAECACQLNDTIFGHIMTRLELDLSVCIPHFHIR